MEQDRACEKCTHAVLDKASKGRAQVKYARCGNPKAKEGRVMSFCSTQRQFFGLCAGGKLFEPKQTYIDA